MAKPKAGQEQAAFDHNQDRYPDAETVMRRIIDDKVLPLEPIERLEVTCLASGEATYRVWPARAEEPDGGYLPPLK